MVEVQPRSGIATALDSVASVTTYSRPARLTCLSRFLGRFIYLLPSTAPPVSIISHCITYFSMLHLLTTSSPGEVRHPPGLFPPLLPSSLHHSSLFPVPHACFCRYVPRPVFPPLPTSACAQVTVGSWRCASPWFPHLSFFLTSLSLCDILPPFIF